MEARSGKRSVPCLGEHNHAFDEEACRNTPGSFVTRQSEPIAEEHTSESRCVFRFLWITINNSRITYNARYLAAGV